MVPEASKRTLAAIFSADVKGYSRLMGDDEEATVQTLKTYRKVLIDTIRRHRGRVVDCPGDNVLAAFASVVDAVRSAVEIQEEIKRRNEGLPEQRRMVFRIGINLGDVIEERGRFYGDGVNIAARIEELADGEGICLSGSAHEQVESKLPQTYEYLGEHAVKNIAKPVPVYRVAMAPEDAAAGAARTKPAGRRGRRVAVVVAVVLVLGAGTFAVWRFSFQPRSPMIEPASVEKMAFPLPEKPSIVVLPFENLSGDPEQDHVADGLTENIIAALANVSRMFVIARSSAFTYKNKPVDVRRVSEELGVRYVLEGSLQKSGDRLRVTVNLIDAPQGHHVWSKRYDRDMDELFAVQDDITGAVTVSLQVELTEGEQARMHFSPRHFDAWTSAVQAGGHFQRFTKSDNARARELLERAVALDPDYGHGWSFLAWTHWIDARFGFTPSTAQSLGEAVELATKAVRLDPELSDAHALLGSIHLAQGEYDRAIVEGRRAIDLSPNSADNHAIFALTMYFVGDWTKSIELFRRAMRLSPFYPSWYLLYLGRAQTFRGDYEAAIATQKTGLEHGEGPEMRAGFHAGLAFTHMEAGDVQLAREHMGEALKLSPHLSERYYEKAHGFFKNAEDLDRLLHALRRAGLPEHPPMP